MFKISPTWYSGADSWTPTGTKPFPSMHIIWTQLWHAHFHLALCHFLLSHPFNSYPQTSTLQIFHLQTQFYSQCSPCFNEGSTITVVLGAFIFCWSRHTGCRQWSLPGRESSASLCLFYTLAFRTESLCLSFYFPRGRLPCWPFRDQRLKSPISSYPTGRKTSYQFFKICFP